MSVRNTCHQWMNLVIHTEALRLFLLGHLSGTWRLLNLAPERQLRRYDMVASRSVWSLVGKAAKVAMEEQVEKEEQVAMAQILILPGRTPASTVRIPQRHLYH